MEKSPPNNRYPQPPNSRFSTKKGRSGYEPSDTETEWQEIPRHERERMNLTLGPEETKALTLMSKHRRHSSRFENEISSPITGSVAGQSRRRHHSKSPYKLRIADDDDDVSSPITGLDTRRNISPLPRPDLGRNASPYKPEREKHNGKHEQRTPPRENRQAGSVSQKPNHRRAVTAPRLRIRERDQNSNNGHPLQNGGRTLSPLSRGMILKQREAFHLSAPSVGEINEMIAQAKLSKNPTGDCTLLESTESIQPGDIFFSRECNASQAQNNSLPKSLQPREFFTPMPTVTINPMRGPPSHQESRGNGNLNMNIRSTSSSNVLSRTTTGPSSAATSRKGSGTSKPSASSSVTSDASGKTSASMRQFTANRKKSKTDNAWFACMRKGSCRTSRKSPEHRSIDEASYIDRALVVESLPEFWADKHQPASLNGFICNKQEAQLLKELVSLGNFPHILLKGPDSGKRELAMALVREIYGDACCNLSHDLRHFPIQERRPMKVSVPITSSSHHMELDVNLEPNAKFALMGLIKEISSEFAITPEVSNINFKSDYKVILLYEVDKAGENIQHMIKWIIDRYSDICKLVLLCEDHLGILEPVINRCKVIKVDAPLTHEIMEVLIQIAEKEDFDLSMNFAAKIATKSKHNLRRAIMALEACKAHNYPFSEEQPIPVGWEEILIEVAAEILADPSYSRLLSIRGKFQKLLVDFVHPKLILQKLVEQFLKRIDASLKRELYYWHAYYDIRLPPGTTALLKLEEFVAKFMSIYRKSSSSRQYV